MAKASNKEVEKALEVAWKIPGLYRRDEGRFLYQLARRKGSIVEIGCWMGRTTAILVQAARVWGASLTTIDAFAEMPSRYEAATAAKWRHNLTKVGLTPPRLLAMPSDEAHKVYEGEIAFLFIDGDHNYQGVANDLANWTPRVKVGGVVALHDMWLPSVTGVCQAVVEWWSRERVGVVPKWRFIGQRHLTIAFRRQR